MRRVSCQAMSRDDPDARRRARAAWPVRLTHLADETTEPMPGTVAQRLTATWELTHQAWAVAGLPIPTYDRACMPVRLVRLGEDDQ